MVDEPWRRLTRGCLPRGGRASLLAPLLRFHPEWPLTGWTPQDIWLTIRRARLIRVLIIYLGASFAALQIVDVFVQQLGLPDWFFPGAIALLIVGLPIILATALVQSAAALPSSESAGFESTAGFESASMIPELATPPEAEATTAAEVAAVAKSWLTWNRAILGGVLAFAAWGVIVTAYMTMRALGIGPVGSLVAAGVLDERERIILADFQGGDSLLAAAATEAFRVDLSQSPLFTIVQPRSLSQALQRMEVDRTARLDPELATEVAMREGIKAVIAGEINTAGAGYLLSARLIATASGEELAAFRENAEDSTAILPAIDRLSKNLRERVGESLKSIRADEPLERVTTRSLSALRRYSQAVKAADVEGDNEKGIALLEEAIAADTGFAMAHRKLAAVLFSNSIQRARAMEAATRAYEYRDRLTDRERYLTLGTYYSEVTDETEKAVTALETLLDTYPDDDWAMNNLGILYLELHEFERAEELYRRALDIDSLNSPPYNNSMIAQVGQGKFDAARATLDRWNRNLPGHPGAAFSKAQVYAARGDYDSATAEIQGVRRAFSASLLLRAQTAWFLSNMARVRGRLAEAERLSRELMDANEQLGQYSGYLFGAWQIAYADIWIRGRPERGPEILEQALAQHPFDSLAPLDRPYAFYASLYATAGEVERANELLSEQAAEAPPQQNEARGWRHQALGLTALARGSSEEAISELRRFEQFAAVDICGACYLSYLARAYDEAGVADSARAVYERYLDTPFFNRGAWDSYWLAFTYERLGSLYEARDDKAKAVYYYGKLVDLWEDADPELQPRVEAARRAIRALSTDS